MADQYSNDGSSSSNISGESSDSVVELKIKTLDSRIFSFKVEKSMPVLVFKEKIANEIGLPVGQQRLIFRGKVLKDDHLLSEYHVENGHTLHLVERQPTQSQPSSDASAGETNGNTSNRGNEGSAGPTRNRVGQISHSVLLGTFNVGDQGEGIVPDLTRVIGAVLNSFGVGGQPGTNGTSITQSSAMASQGNETDGSRGNAGGQNQAGNQAHPATLFPGQAVQFSPQVMQVPLTAAGAIPVPSLNSPIPDSLNTLSEFITRLGQALSQNGYQPNSSSINTENLARVELPYDMRGLPTPETLSTVLRQAQRLLGNEAIDALSHIAGRLEQERDSSDPTVRGQVQAESVQAGLAMQHLGALFLELGRTILTLRMGQSPAEASINAGPAVYISPSGPNPIMVQPFPLQANSLFNGSNIPSNPMTLGPVGIGNAPRHINIHIHAGTALAPVVSAVGSRPSSGEGIQGERSGSTVSGSMRVLPVRNVIAAVPARAAGVAISSAAQPALGASVSQPPTDSSLSSVIAEVNSRIRNFVGNMQGESQVTSDGDGVTGQPNNMPVTGDGGLSAVLPAVMPESESQKPQPQCAEASTGSVEGASSSSENPTKESEDLSGSALRSSDESANAVPLGLGLAGLERKRRVKLTQASARSDESGTTSAPLDQNLNGSNIGQQLLRSLTSGGSATRSSGSSGSSGRQSSDDPLGSPDIFRNMLQQLTQSPQIMNTVSQIAQQVDSQDLGNMLSGLGGGQGGGIDLSRMVQQMMPVVTRALSRGPNAPQSFPTVEPELQRSRGADQPNNPDLQIDLQEVAQRVEHSDLPEDVFRAVVENAVQLQGSGGNFEELLEDLCSNENLVHEYVQMLRRDIRGRFQDGSGMDKF